MPIVCVAVVIMVQDRIGKSVLRKVEQLEFLINENYGET
jgi:hypothetical protein